MGTRARETNTFDIAPERLNPGSAHLFFSRQDDAVTEQEERAQGGLARDAPLFSLEQDEASLAEFVRAQQHRPAESPKSQLQEALQRPLPKDAKKAPPR